MKQISIKEYHAENEHISATQIKEAIKSMAHFKHYNETKSDERKSHFEFGNAFEIALSDYLHGTNEFDDVVVVYDEQNRPENDKGITSKINQEWKKSILLSEKYVISATGDESLETIQQMLKSFENNDTAKRLLANTIEQPSFFWKDKNGVKLKSRPDYIKRERNAIIDIKTTNDASPQSFAKQVANFNYPIQAEMQMRGLKQHNGKDIVAYYWLVFEKKAPYNVQVYEYQENDWQFVSDKLDMTLTRIALAQQTNNYQGYSENALNQYGILDLELPLYYRF